MGELQRKNIKLFQTYEDLINDCENLVKSSSGNGFEGNFDELEGIVLDIEYGIKAIKSPSKLKILSGN